MEERICNIHIESPSISPHYNLFEFELEVFPLYD